MPRPEKVAAVAEITERIENAQAVFLAEYAGLSVKEQQELRRGLSAQGAEFKVLKMTLTRRAAAALGLNDLDELLIGPTGVAFADGDPVTAAKALKDFAAAHDVFTIKGGLLGTDFLTPARISELAEIAPREQLLAMLAGALKAPLTALASVLAALPRGTATAMQQLLEKKQAGEFVAVAAATAEPKAAADDAPPVEEEAATDDGAETADTEVPAAQVESEVAADAPAETPDDDADAIPEAPAPEPADADASADDDSAEASVEAAAETEDEDPEDNDDAAPAAEEE